jgi:ABC-type antimicrobial peptide transport system permease subunit
MLFISVFERQREIGVMRSVGAGSGTIISQFLTEGLLIGGIAWLIGVPLSYGIAKALTSLLPVGEFGFSYPPVVAALGLLGMLVMAGMASIWPSLSAARRTVSDILRYQ